MRQENKMKNINNCHNHVKALDKRMARASGHSGIICIPAGCIGKQYERYIGTETGVITLIPCENKPRGNEEVDA